MSIKEKDLQTIESLSDGDKLRVVTSEGNSRNIPASAIGDSGNGGIFIINTIGYDDEEFTIEGADKTFEEITSAISNNQLPVLYVRDTNLIAWVAYLKDSSAGTIVFVSPKDYGINKCARFNVNNQNSWTCTLF